MHIGISAYDLPAQDFLALARAADEAGVTSLWLGEHVFQPRHTRSVHPGSQTKQHHTGPLVQEQTNLLDPLTTLAAAAAVTTRVRLATGIFVLPLRHPLLVSRALATMQEISDGRITLGVGAGWMKEEFDALGVDFAERGRRVRESVAVLRSTLSGGFVNHRGNVFDFEDLQMVAAPVEVPIILGGNGDVALRRAAAIGDGWFSSGSPGLSEAARLRDRLHEYLVEFGRDPDHFEVVVRPDQGDLETIAAYADAGFRHIVVWADQVWDSRLPAEEQVANLRDLVDGLDKRSS